MRREPLLKERLAPLLKLRLTPLLKARLTLLRRRGLLALGLLLSGTCIFVAYRKFIGHPVTMATHQGWGIPPHLTRALGVIEAVAGLLLPFRPTAFYGGLIFTWVISGAVWMHILHGEYSRLALPLAFLPLAAGYTWLTRKPEPR